VLFRSRIAYDSLNLRFFDGIGAPMDAPTALGIFESFEIIASNNDRGAQMSIGFQDNISSIAGGVLSIPIDPENEFASFNVFDFARLTVLATLRDDAFMTSPNTFRVSLEDGARLLTTHNLFRDEPVNEQVPMDFITETITILEGDSPDCVGDCDGSLTVNFNDLVCVLFLFGETSGIGDVDGSGLVDFNDLVEILFRFGPCNKP